MMPKSPAIVGALYHPLKPVYQTSHLLQQLERNVETILRDFPRSLIILAGDLSQLSDSSIVQSTGSYQRFYSPLGYCNLGSALRFGGGLFFCGSSADFRCKK